MNNTLLRPLLAEFIGTFTLVFIGAMAVIVAPQFGVVVPALAHGLILVALAAAYGHISGGHFNPAVTLAIIVGGKIAIPKAVFYWIVQFVGAVAAAYLLRVVLGDATGNFGQATGSLTTGNIGQAALLEGILTFFLVSTIYQTAVLGKAGAIAPIAIGLTLGACILAGGVFTGASLNPARTLGPALAAGDFTYVIPYLAGQFIGGAVGGFIHAYILDK